MSHIHRNVYLLGTLLLSIFIAVRQGKAIDLNVYQLEVVNQLIANDVSQIIPLNGYIYYEDEYSEGYFNLKIADVTNPAFPTVVGAMDATYELTVEGNYGYGIQGGLEIYDMSDPTQPVLLNIYDGFATYQGEEASLLDLAVYQQTAYVSYYYWIERCYAGSNLDVIDVSDPLNPVYLLSLGPIGGVGSWGDIEIIDHYAYILTHRMDIFDLITPHQPRFVGGAFYGPYTFFPLTSDLYVADNQFHITSAVFSTPCRGNDAMWQVLNRNTPTDFSEAVTYQDKSIGIGAIADGYLYIAEGAQVKIISVVDHANPVFTFDSLYPYSIALIDGFTYVGHEEGLDIFRMSAVAEWVEPALGVTMAYTDSYGLAAQVAVGAGSVISPTRLSYLPYPAVTSPPTDTVFVAAFDLVGYGEQFTLEHFTQPVTLTLDYENTRTAGYIIGQESRLLWWSGNDWQEAAESCSPTSSYWRDPTHYRLQLAVCRPGKYVLVAPAGPVFLPALFQPF